MIALLRLLDLHLVFRVVSSISLSYHSLVSPRHPLSLSVTIMSIQTQEGSNKRARSPAPPLQHEVTLVAKE